MMLMNLFAGVEISLRSNTFWEQLTCVGYNPNLSQLEAVVSIKQATGYSGNLCSNGSTEYVAFFVDWGDGTGFQPVGLTSFKVADISNAPPGPQHPLQYMVYYPLADRSHRKCCDKEVLPRVRAILSWNQIPSGPNYFPIFGNRLEANIQIRPSYSIFCLLKDIVFDPNAAKKMVEEEQSVKALASLKNVDINAELCGYRVPQAKLEELAPLYKRAGVEDHRTVFNVAYPLIKGGETLQFSSMIYDKVSIKKAGIDLSKVVDALSVILPQGNTTYEEVICAGLNTASDILGAVIHIKKPSGYSGDLCKNGSIEYVAFWADWDNNGVFDDYLGTANVEVHDIVKFPAGGLHYSVMLPANFTKRLKACNNPNIIRLRAVLSWAVPPSTTDPNDLNYWGNRLDLVVQIRPGSVNGELFDLIYDVGNVPLPSISSITYLAYPSAIILANCSQLGDRPFAGNVRIGGRIYNTGAPGTVRYQVQYAPQGSGSWQPVATTMTWELMHPNPFDPLYPQENVTMVEPDGWFQYMENPLAAPPIFERTAHLASWQTGSLNGPYDLRLAYTKDYPITPASVIHYSNVVTIVLDNVNYVASPTANPVVDPASTLDIVIDGGDCHAYDKGATIDGHLRALDLNFWLWTLDLQPATHTNGAQASPQCRSYASLADGGDANAEWHLDTSKLDKCGYTLTIRAYDRVILNSNAALTHENSKAVGFSVK
ncbi:MAG: hypothetical protein LUO89_11650 [Methanothrix sp.]|nr:hypothetical protein [Methanothrix sp.]